ncbi:MAG: pyridoxamine 5'-phosphate oxidase family protein [Mycolicibacterium neoaurum]|nr:pyridoxamine 5'-phosphate oxidase family protein [Mycolicibacterium neoaurum]
MSITDAIETSKAGANTFTRQLFEDQWSADRVASFINERRNATIATVSQTGQPHAAVVIAASVRDEIYFTVNPDSVLARNLAENDRIALSVCDSIHSVMSQGRAVKVGPAPTLPDLIGELAAATSSGTFTPAGWEGDIYRADIRRLVAN